METVRSDTDLMCKIAPDFYEAVDALGLDDLRHFQDVEGKPYRELMKELIPRYRTDERLQELGQRALSSLFPHNPAFVAEMIRFLNVDPYASGSTPDIVPLVENYALAVGAVTVNIEVVDAIEGILAGARSARAFANGFGVLEPLLIQALDTARQQAMQTIVLLACRIGAVVAEDLANRIVDREQVGTEIASCIHRQVLQIGRGLATSTAIDGSASPVFSHLLRIYEAGFLPVGEDAGSFLVFNLAA